MSEQGRFARALTEWMDREGIRQRELAGLIGCHESLLSMVRLGTRKPTPEFMAGAIARAPEPWKSALKMARQADQDAADALAAAVAVA